MRFPPLIGVPLSILFAGCILIFSSCSKTPKEDVAEDVTAQAGDGATKPNPASQTSGSEVVMGAVRDASFTPFLKKLQAAAAKRDSQAMAPLMTADFGYRIQPLGMGEGVFPYWEENNLWPELELVLKEKWAPLGNFLVAPAEFATSPSLYSGYRAGCVKRDGTWKFAYFVTGR